MTFFQSTPQWSKGIFNIHYWTLQKKCKKAVLKVTGNVQGDPISLSENIKRNVGGISIRLQLAKKLKNLRRNVGGIRAHFFLLNAIQQNLFGYLVVEVTNLLVM